MLLRPGLAAPTHVARLTALGIAFAAAGLFAVAKPALEQPVPQGMPTIAMTTPIDVTLDEAITVQTEPPPIDRSLMRNAALVFEAQNATWMKLENLAIPGIGTDNEGETRRAFPKHGPVRYAQEKWIETAIGDIALADVPAAYRERLGDKIIVDGPTAEPCVTYITGFAIVARLTGDTSYAGTDGESWNAKNVLANGAPMLAAKLGSCSGTFARDGALPDAVHMTYFPEPKAALVAAAKQKLLRSPDAHATTTEWRSQITEGPDWSKHEATKWDTKVFEHTTTREMWISIHAHQMEGCGSPYVNVWGLYRIEADGSLTSLEAKLGEITEIEELVDFDNDGIVEVVGKEWLGARRINDVTGKTLDRLDVPFYGCPC